eukprot:11198722-Lingulodinium_polyedra.AAC.1
MDAVFVRHDKVRVQVTDVLRAADDVETEQALASHASPDVPRLEETLGRVGFAPGVMVSK